MSSRRGKFNHLVGTSVWRKGREIGEQQGCRETGRKERCIRYWSKPSQIGENSKGEHERFSRNRNFRMVSAFDHHVAGLFIHQVQII